MVDTPDYFIESCLIYRGTIEYYTLLVTKIAMCFEQCTIPMISKLLRAIERLEMCTEGMILKHMEISHKQSVLFYGTPVIFTGSGVTRRVIVTLSLVCHII